MLLSDLALAKATVTVGATAVWSSTIRAQHIHQSNKQNMPQTVNGI